MAFKVGDIVRYTRTNARYRIAHIQASGTPAVPSGEATYWLEPKPALNRLFSDRNFMPLPATLAKQYLVIETAAPDQSNTATPDGGPKQ